jgi:hypothetical protein
MAKLWAKAAETSGNGKVYDQGRPERWHRMACAADGAPYVLRKWLQQVEFCDQPEACQQGQAEKSDVIAAALLDEKSCLATRLLSEDEKAKLRSIRDRDLPLPPLVWHPIDAD